LAALSGGAEGDESGHQGGTYLRPRNILILAVILVVLAGVFYLVRQPKPTTPAEPTVYVWDIDMDYITHIEIQLPREDLSQSFIKIPQGDQFPWFFDDPQHSPVDTARWGGGIPLLLSGPGAARVLPNPATAEQLTEYGLTQPSMKIIVIYKDPNKDTAETIESDVGDFTPDGENCYVRAPGSNQVALVDITWYQVLERLVKEPPYATKS
jgi:hypothetical protein